MRFEELRLVAYGPFTDRTLKLRPGLNVLYGPNEAGKSSALRAVHAMLFGFGHKTSDDFLHNYNQLRVGAVLIDDQGERLECVRRKGRSATLRDGDDNEPIDESRLQAMLGGVTEEFYSTVFGIDHERLREGGEDVVKGEGRIGELLFAAGGVTHLREKQQSLEARAAALFKPRASNPQINKALSQLKDLNEEIRRLQRSPEEWAAHDTQHRRLTARIAELTRGLEEAESTLSRLGRIRSALGFLASWKTKRGELESLEAVVMLPEDAEKRFRAASLEQSVAESDYQKSQARIAEVQRQLDALQVPADLLAAADRIDDLYLRLGSHRKAATDRVGLEAQQRTARDDAKRAIQKLGWEVSLDEAAQHRLPDEKKARVRKLAAKQGEVTRAAREQQQLLAKLAALRADLESQLAQMEAREFPTGLKDRLAAATPILVVEDKLAAWRANVARLEVAADEALARLTRWEGTLDGACRLKTPSEATIESYDESLHALRSDAATHSKQLADNRDETERVAQELAALELAESVPTEDELSRLRAIRDRGLGLAVRGLRGESVDPGKVEAFVGDVGEGEDLPAALEPSVRNADAVADRLRRESKRVAQKSQLLAKQAALAQQAAALDAQRSKAMQSREAWDAAWRACWQEAGVDPATPAEMRSWLRRHAEVLSLADNLRSARAELAEDEARVGRLQESLREELRRNGVDASDGASLRELHAQGQRRLEEAQSSLRERERVQSDLARAVADAKDADAARRSAEADLAEWKGAWADALRPLRLDADASPEQAEAVLSNLASLFEALENEKVLGKRIWGIGKTAEELQEHARGVCEAVAADLVDLPIEQMIPTLHQRLAEGRETQRAVASLQKQLKSEREASGKAQSKLASSGAALDALVTEAGCPGRGDLPAALDRSTRKRHLAAEVEDLRSRLTQFCVGKPLEEFAAEAESVDPDRLPSQVEQLDGQIGSLRSERDEAIRAKEETAGLLRQFGGASAAADKAAEREYLLSQLEEDARDYAVAVVASRLLQRAVERYQEKSQGPVLAGASAYFAKLTCGAFAELKPELDESGQQVLVGSRGRGSGLPVQAMSEGTRDQLYLALRLGTVDYWLTQHGGLPIVVDDILLAFDDGRARATLEVLLELSRKTQVLFFTHHSHLVTIAEEAGRLNPAGANVQLLAEPTL